MARLLKDMKWLMSQKIYVIALAITAVCGYGFEIVTPIIGIDDTAMELYFEEGLAVAMGRWTIFLLNKIFHVAEFAPFMLELIGVVFLCVAATIFALLFYRILGEKAGVLACAVFSCIFVSNPILSDTFVYYIHNGVGLGYILTALALVLYVDVMEETDRKCILYYVYSMLLAWIAVGCYESFLILYIMGMITLLFLKGLSGKDKLTFGYVLKYLSLGALLTIGVVVLRTVIIEILSNGLGLKELLDSLPGVNRRSLLEIMNVIKYEGGFGELLKMLVKRYWVVYSVNAIVYLPIWSYMFATFVLGIYAVVAAFRRKASMFPVLFVGMVFTPFLLTLFEGRVHYYRSCQYMPFITATGVFLLYYALAKCDKFRMLRYAAAGFAVILTFNQASRLNENFYVDYLKYEHLRKLYQRWLGRLSVAMEVIPRWSLQEITAHRNPFGSIMPLAMVLRNFSILQGLPIWWMSI